ncbi:SYF2 splicing factor-domain-containing protein [Cladochytrium replicatum]|nr:SYF2 splicing factor-domain-containing protein [Cladochytrium replicatum]
MPSKRSKGGKQTQKDTPAEDVSSHELDQQSTGEEAKAEAVADALIPQSRKRGRGKQPKEQNETTDAGPDANVLPTPGKRRRRSLGRASTSEPTVSDREEVSGEANNDAPNPAESKSEAEAEGGGTEETQKVNGDNTRNEPKGNNGSAVKQSGVSDRLQKFQMLKKKLNESKQANRQEVFAEHQRKKENPKEQLIAEKKRKEAELLLEKQRAEEEGEDFERIRSMSWSVEDVDRWQEKQEKKAFRADEAFTDFQQAAAKKYKKLADGLKPNIKQYNDQKHLSQLRSGTMDVVGNDFYRDANSMAYARAEDKAAPEDVERVVKDLEKQLEARDKFSRRRAYHEDDEITFINERNMRFNKKIGRAYDKYTAEIKASFERGTAL